MRKISLLFAAFLTLFLVSCEGPSGPPGVSGPPGTPGEDGSFFEAAAFEIEIDFSLNSEVNLYEFGPEQYPSDISLTSGDKILVYRLEETNDGLDVWRQLPQPFFAEGGLLFYNFDFTQADFGLFIEPEFDAELIPSELVDAQVFRIVIVPTDFTTASKVDESNISSVLNALDVEEQFIRRLKM